MIVLFEGPDGSGKTTFINNTFSNIEYVHYSHFPTRNDAFTTFERLLESIIDNPRDLIIDRFHISELIYGKNYHNEWLSIHRYNYLEKLCKIIGMKVVCCLPPWNVVLSNWSNRLEIEMIKDNIRLYNIWNAYNNIRSFTDLPVINYDYTTSESAKNIIIQLL